MMCIMEVMDEIFNKALVITDAHFGRGSNSITANQDNIDFLIWAIDRAKSWGAKTCIFMGDYFDNRYQLGVITINYALNGLEMLNEAFEQVYMISGNHDLPFREKRHHSSIEIARNLSRVKILRDPTTLGDVTFLPWLVGNEHKTIRNIKSRYVFGHLELPGFVLNSGISMPESADLIKADEFLHSEYVFTGHFHARQTKKFKNTNIVYTGNIMPFNFCDANDSNRGIMLLEFGKDPIFEAWPDQPLYTSINLSTLLKDEKKYLKPKMTLKVMVDIPTSHEDIQEMKDIFSKTHGLRKLQALPVDHEEEQEMDDTVQFRDVDQMFMEGLQAVESKGLSNNKLVDIYSKLCN